MKQWTRTCQPLRQGSCGGVHRMVDGETKDKKHEKEVTVKWRTHNSYVSRSKVWCLLDWITSLLLESSIPACDWFPFVTLLNFILFTIQLHVDWSLSILHYSVCLTCGKYPAETELARCQWDLRAQKISIKLYIYIYTNTFVIF